MLALILKYYQMHFKILELWFQCNFQSMFISICAQICTTPASVNLIFGKPWLERAAHSFYRRHSNITLSMSDGQTWITVQFLQSLAMVAMCWKIFTIDLVQWMLAGHSQYFIELDFSVSSSCVVSALSGSRRNLRCQAWVWKSWVSVCYQSLMLSPPSAKMALCLSPACPTSQLAHYPSTLPNESTPCRSSLPGLHTESPTSAFHRPDPLTRLRNTSETQLWTSQ